MSLKEVLIELESRLGKWETGISDIRKAIRYFIRYGYLQSLNQITITDNF